jgi:hypothetical protein
VKFKGVYTAITALSLVIVPTMAAAVPVATPLTQPASESVQGDDALVGGGSGFILAILAIAAVAAGIAAGTGLGQHHHNDHPNSP